MHDDVLKFVWTALGETGVDTSHLSEAERTGSLFWVISFILPSTVLTCVGLLVLVWSQSPRSVAVSMSVGTVYCIWRLFVVLRNIARTLPKDVPTDLEKGNIT
jgi:hypothetical protein